MRGTATGLAAILVFTLVAASFAAEAQPAGKVYRVGILGEKASDPSEARLWQVFRLELGKRGWIEGKNILIESRWTEGNPARLPELAADLVRLRVDLIVTRGSYMVQAAKTATSSIPIVFTMHADPIRAASAPSSDVVTGVRSGTPNPTQIVSARRITPSRWPLRGHRTEALASSTGGSMGMSEDFAPRSPFHDDSHVIYAKAFFDLQLQFARRVATLSGLAFERALFDYTNLYVRFGLGRDFDAAHPTWQEYLAGLPGTDDGCEWTYRFYLVRPEVTTAPGVVATFGCFSYARLGDDRIRLHFQNAETDGHSPLGIDRLGQRLADLAALFEHVKRALPQPLQVIGASWLYNLDAYRRLFPPSYLATAHVIDHRFRHLPLWGQFVDRYGETKTSMTRQFLECLERQSSMANLGQCFPFHVLRVEASVLAFYDFYRV